MYYVYLIRCTCDVTYIGMTSNLERRMQQHRSGKGGSPVTETFKPILWRILGSRLNRNDAYKLEYRWARRLRQTDTRVFGGPVDCCRKSDILAILRFICSQPC